MGSGQLLVDVTGLEIVTERVEIERGSVIEWSCGSISGDLMWLVGCSGWHIGIFSVGGGPVR
jgi:hypothetical protein